MKKCRGAKSKIKGRGLFADEAIATGEYILEMSGTRLSAAQVARLCKRGVLRWDDPFEIGGGYYIRLDPLPLLGNHSCAPNAGIRGENELVALRDIARGEEITYDYSTVVGQSAADESDWLLHCTCGARTCRGTIGNWRMLPRARLLYYKKHRALPDFVLTQLTSQCS